jgi:hypothetical protein
VDDIFGGWVFALPWRIRILDKAVAGKRSNAAIADAFSTEAVREDSRAEAVTLLSARQKRAVQVRARLLVVFSRSASLTAV